MLVLAQVDGTATAVSNVVQWNNGTYTLPSGGTWVYFARGIYESSNFFVSGTESGGTRLDVDINCGIAIRKS